jgi:hypothetical protein
MESTLDHQIGLLRKHAIEHEFEGRVAAQGGLLDEAFSILADIVERWQFKGRGKGPMPQLKNELLGQLLGLIDSLDIDLRIKLLMRQELPFGTSVVLNLIEVIPAVLTKCQVELEPLELVASPIIVRAANQIGSCPGYIAPVIRREFTRFRDEQAVDWVRDDGEGNERHDWYVAENFTLNGDGVMRLQDATFLRMEDELKMREKKVSYGGCPASRFLIGHEYGNLLNAMAHVVSRACIDYFDFQVQDTRLVRRDKTEQVFYPDPSPINRDLYL